MSVSVPQAAASDLLEAIVAATRRITEERASRRSAAALEAAVASAPRSRGFRAALLTSRAPAVIAECKRRSPSRGVLRADYDPAAIAAAYARHGAAAISVLTEPAFFDGSPDHLAAARAIVDLPLLRKDFVIDRYQLLEARLAGADAVLLIVAALSDMELRSLLGEARSLGLDSLVEVHDEGELERAIAAGADLVGVNNRNLRTLAVDVDTSRRLAALIPSDVVAVAESGLRSGEELAALGRAGYRAFLMGERFMTAENPGEALGELIEAARGQGPQG